jgi:hypothetical protein
MRVIARQLMSLAAALAALYGVLLGATLLFFPSAPAAPTLDTGLAADTIFMTEPKYAFLNRSPLTVPHSRLVLLGASNTVVGFRPPQLAPLLPEIEIDNLAVGGSNLTQIAQIVDLTQEMQKGQARHDTTFVLGIWYGLFATNRARWYTPERHPGDTDIDIERYRYGFYRRTDRGPVAVLPPKDLSLGVLFVHPLLVLDKLSREATSGLRPLIRGKAALRTDAQRDATVLSESDKLKALAYWREQMQTERELDPEQFDVLKNLIGRIIANGDRVIIIDLPIPHWHAERSPVYPSYVRQMDALISGYKSTQGSAYIDMKGQDNDLDFSDEVHPKPRVTRMWAERLAEQLRLQAIPALVVKSSAPRQP